MTKLLTTLDHVQRMANTENGKAKYLINASGRNWVTSPDAKFLGSQIIPNLIVGETVLLTVDDNDQISNIQSPISWDTNEALECCKDHVKVHGGRQMLFLNGIGEYQAGDIRLLNKLLLAKFLARNCGIWGLDASEVDVDYIFSELQKA